MTTVERGRSLGGGADAVTPPLHGAVNEASMAAAGLRADFEMSSEKCIQPQGHQDRLEQHTPEIFYLTQHKTRK